MSIARITKRAIDALKPRTREFTSWDGAVAGFGVRVRPSGSKSFVVVYRAGPGRGARVRRFTIGNVGKITPESARTRAKAILGAAAMGEDPADRKANERDVPTVGELVDRFLAEHVHLKRKASTAERYRDILHRIVKPEFRTEKADKLTRMQLTRLHSSLARTPFQANRMLAVRPSRCPVTCRNQSQQPLRGSFSRRVTRPIRTSSTTPTRSPRRVVDDPIASWVSSVICPAPTGFEPGSHVIAGACVAFYKVSECARIG